MITWPFIRTRKQPNQLPFVHKEKMAVEVVDEAIQNDMHIRANRNMKILDMAPDGSTISMWISAAMDMDNDSAWHPKRLFKEVTENCGYPNPNFHDWSSGSKTYYRLHAGQLVRNHGLADCLLCII